MQFSAKVRYLAYSPYKLRPITDAIRGKTARYAIQWLNTSALQRAVPVKKMIESAVANAKNLQDVALDALRIKDLRVDQGRIQRYYKPGAMGRANVQRKRFSHMSVVLESVDKKEAKRGTKG